MRVNSLLRLVALLHRIQKEGLRREQGDHRENLRERYRVRESANIDAGRPSKMAHGIETLENGGQNEHL